MNHIYEVSTGGLISSTILPVTDLKEGHAVKASDKTGVWDTDLLDFVPRPENKVISKLDFLDLFTDDELEAIIAKSKENSSVGHKVSVFIQRLELSETVDLKSDRANTAVNGMEELGLIAPGRAAEILA